jgi:hypothetical protein
MYHKKQENKMTELKQLKIETYNLVDFVMQIQQAVLGGYIVTDKSDEAPMCIGNCYHLIMSEREYQPMPVANLSLAVYTDTTKLQETVALCLESVNHLNKSLDDQMLADSLTDSVVVEEVDYTKDADKWDNRELGADEAFVETIEPPKEPALDEVLPKDEQVVLQAKQTTKRGKK